MEKLKLELTAAQAAAVVGITVQAFSKWRLKPVRQAEGRALYRWDDVRKMRDLKRASRTRIEPRDSYADPDDALTSVVKLSAGIAESAQAAFDEGDLEELATQLGRMKALAKAAGIDGAEGRAYVGS